MLCYFFVFVHWFHIHRQSKHFLTIVYLILLINVITVTFAKIGNICVFSDICCSINYKFTVRLWEAALSLAQLELIGLTNVQYILCWYNDCVSAILLWYSHSFTLQHDNSLYTVCTIKLQPILGQNPPKLSRTNWEKGNKFYTILYIWIFKGMKPKHINSVLMVQL